MENKEWLNCQQLNANDVDTNGFQELKTPSGVLNATPPIGIKKEETKICHKCGLQKPLNKYYKHVETADGHLNVCSLCINKHRREYRLSHPDIIRQQYIVRTPKRKEYEKANIERIHLTKLKWRLSHKEQIHNRSIIYNQSHKKERDAYHLKHKERLTKQRLAVSLSRKKMVLTHYGNVKCACIRCGFDDIRALSIDHINNNGAEERRENKNVGNKFYYWLIKQSLPHGYQTLCMNCQWIKKAEYNENRRSINAK